MDQVTMGTRRLAGATLMAVMVGWGTAALAADAGGVSPPAQVHAFTVAPQGLAGALDRFADQAGLSFVHKGGILEALSSPGLQGDFAVAEALNRLLVGSGLTWRFVDAHTVVLEKVAAEGAMTLAPVTVEGSVRAAGMAAETPTAPLKGYVARRAMAGTKTDTPLIETPQSVSVVTADQIAAQKATSLSQALGYTPGVSTQSGGFSRTYDDLMMRGFNVANGNSGMLRDGMKYQSNVYDGGQEPYGMERIEVMRGAASVLYGQLAPGGVVNAVSKRPTDTALREGSVEYGSDDRKQISADMGGRLNDDGSLALRLTGLMRQSDNWVDNTPDDKVYLAPALRWQDDDTTLTLLGNYQKIDAGFSTPLLYGDVSSDRLPRSAFLGIDGFDTYQADTASLALLLERRLGADTTLRSNNRQYRSDVTWNYMVGNLASLASTGGRLARLASARDETSQGTTSDTSVEHRTHALGADHTMVGGFDYYRRVYNSHRYRGTAYSLLNLATGASSAPPSVSYAVDRGSLTDAHQYGVYAQDQMKFGDHWVWLVGGRHDWARSETNAYQTGLTTSQDDRAWTGRTGLVYLLDNGVAPYASVSQSFQPQAGTDIRTGSALKPNEGLQYEAGLRYQPAALPLSFSAAAYQINQTNVLTLDAAGNTYQQGRVRSRGAEFEARGEIGPIGLVGAYTYTAATIRQSADPAEVGEQVALVPRHAASLWGDVGLDGLGLDGVRTGAGLRYVGETNLTDSAEKVPGYILVDAMASVDLKTLSPDLDGVTFKLNARNLLDKQFYTCASSDGCRYGEPLTVVGSLSVRW